MGLITALLAATVFPVACLGFLLWMARFEDRLPEAVRRTVRQPDPPPILAIPVQRAAPPVLPATPVQAGAGAGSSAVVSAGGSTNR